MAMKRKEKKQKIPTGKIQQAGDRGEQERKKKKKRHIPALPYNARQGAKREERGREKRAWTITGSPLFR